MDGPPSPGLKPSGKPQLLISVTGRNGAGDKPRPVASTGGSGRLDDPLQTEQKYPVLLEYAKASFERIKQRLRHL